MVMLINSWGDPKTFSGRTIVSYDEFAENYEPHYNYYIELKDLILEHIKVRNLKYKEFDHIVPVQNMEFFIDENGEISYRPNLHAIKMKLENMFIKLETIMNEFIKFQKYSRFSYKRYLINKHIKNTKIKLQNLDVSTIKLDKEYNFIDLDSIISFPDIYTREVQKMETKFKEKNSIINI